MGRPKGRRVRSAADRLPMGCDTRVIPTVRIGDRVDLSSAISATTPFTAPYGVDARYPEADAPLALARGFRTAAGAIWMFEGFRLERIELPEATLRVRIGGSGPPLLLLHGHPRTHAT